MTLVATAEIKGHRRTGEVQVGAQCQNAGYRGATECVRANIGYGRRCYVGLREHASIAIRGDRVRGYAAARGKGPAIRD